MKSSTNLPIAYETIRFCGGGMDGATLIVVSDGKNVYAIQEYRNDPGEGEVAPYPLLMVYRRRNDTNIFDYGMIGLN